MSGAELIGVISAIIAIVDASLKLCEAVDDVSGFSKSFRNVAARLPAIQCTLDAANKRLAEEEEEMTPEEKDINWSESRATLVKVLQGCGDKAMTLQTILQKAIPAAGASRLNRFIKALRTIPNAEKVDSLMNGILSDLQVLTANHAVKTASHRQVKRLLTARTPTIKLHNAGLGAQYVKEGPGNQNVVCGTGLQINGASAEGYHFMMVK